MLSSRGRNWAAEGSGGMALFPSTLTVSSRPLLPASAGLFMSAETDSGPFRICGLAFSGAARDLSGRFWPA
jgi:hypothetical protein